MCLSRKNAPSVPAALRRSASARSTRFSLPENWRRRPTAKTSGSGRLAPEDDGGFPIANADYVARDAGIDGGAATAEEAAVHLVPEDEA